MDYASHYDRLISRARGRVLEGYRERHHVLPRCMGGDDSPGNIVELTAEEHYVAHQLLVKMYPRNGRLSYAAVWMSGRCSSNKAYGWLRRRVSRAKREEQLGKPIGPLSAQHRANLSAACKGRKVLQPAKEKISRAMIGNKHNLGHTASPETRAKMSVSRVGKKRGPHSEETKRKISAVKRGVAMSPESRLKMSLSRRGVPKSAEHRAKISDANYRRRANARRCIGEQHGTG